MVNLRHHLKYTRTVYVYIHSSDCCVNPACNSSKSITIIDLFTTAYLLGGGYYNQYMSRRSSCNRHASGPQIVHNPVLEPWEGREVAACAAWGSAGDTSGQRRVDIQIPCNGLCCVWGPRRRRSVIDRIMS